MAKALSRKVTIYINGKEVEATISSLTAKIKQLENEQKKLPIGTQEYMLFIICKDTKFQSNSQRMFNAFVQNLCAMLSGALHR